MVDMARLAKDLREMRTNLDLTQVELARELKMHFNTISRAESQEKISRNSAARIAAWMRRELSDYEGRPGVAAAGEEGLLLTRFAGKRIAAYGEEAGVEPAEWCSRLIEWLEDQGPRLKDFIRYSVQDYIQAQTRRAVTEGGTGPRPSSRRAVSVVEEVSRTLGSSEPNTG